jgi:hypothetical protein
MRERAAERIVFAKPYVTMAAIKFQHRLPPWEPPEQRTRGAKWNHRVVGRVDLEHWRSDARRFCQRVELLGREQSDRRPEEDSRTNCGY